MKNRNGKVNEGVMNLKIRKNVWIPVIIIGILISSIIFVSLMWEDDIIMYTIADDETGADCSKIGVWDLSSKTCTLNTNVSTGEGIQFLSDNITLDGNGKSINGDNKGVGINIVSKTGITVKNLHISNFYDGVLFDNSHNGTITDLTVLKNVRHGIFLVDSNNNIIKNSTIGSTQDTSIGHGINMDNSHNNFITNNTIKQSRDGIRLQDSSKNVIIRNNISENLIEGVDFHKSAHNQIYYNNFFGPEPSSGYINDVWPELGNVFFNSSGGNYYSDFDESSEGCSDLNADGFCDSFYFFSKGQDELAFVIKDGWLE